MATVSTVHCEELTEERIEAVRAELVETDGEPLESSWHRSAINLLIESTLWHRQGRTDFYVGGNMFIYYSHTQAREKKYRGPDYFLVNNVDGSRKRDYWWVFDEDGKFPDAIMELLSPTTAQEDKSTKKDIYEQIFKTQEYFWYDRDSHELVGWRLKNQKYERIIPNEQGWLWSEELDLWIGLWHGVYQGQEGDWPRFFNSQGQLILTQAESMTQRAEEERQRVQALAAELDKLKALLMEKGLKPPETTS